MNPDTAARSWSPKVADLIVSENRSAVVFAVCPVLMLRLR
jgi:hypothetical protein